MEKVEADEIRAAADVCNRDLDLELPRSTGDSGFVTLTVFVVSEVDVGGGGDHVEFQEALCSMSTLPRQYGLTLRSFWSHMLPALITMDLWGPFLPPEHLSLTLMAI